MKSKDRRNREIKVFSLASFFQDLGSDMIYPIWPLFITTVLNANMEILGLIDGLSDAMTSVSQAASGYLSDRLKKRKIFIWLGYLFGAISRIGYAFSTAWQHIIPFRILDRAGKMRAPPRDAMVADDSNRGNRGSNFGFLRAMDNFGAVCGIIACILLVNYIGYRNLFLLAALPSLVSVLLVIIFIKEKKTKNIYRGLTLKDITPNLKVFLLSSALFATGFFSYSFLLVYSNNIASNLAAVPFLYLVYNIVASIASQPFGRLADRLNRKTVMLISYAFFSLTCIGFIFVNSMEGLVLLFVLYGLHLASKEPAYKTFVCELSCVKYRASTLGAYQMVVGLCALPASVIAGLLWTNFGSSVPFYFSLLPTAASMVILLFVREY